MVRDVLPTYSTFFVLFSFGHVACPESRASEANDNAGASDAGYARQ